MPPNSLQPSRCLTLSGEITCATGAAISFQGEHVLSFAMDVGVRDGMLLGAVLSRHVSLTLHDREHIFTLGRDLYGARVQLYMHQQNERIPLALFIVDTLSRRDASSILTFSGSDFLGHGLENTFQDTLSYPATLKTIGEHILSSAGLPSTLSFALQSHQVPIRPDWGSMTLRSALSLVAQGAGCFCCADGAGRVQFLPAFDDGETPYEIFPASTFQLVRGDVSFGPIKGLQVQLHGSDRDSAPLTVTLDNTPLSSRNCLSIAHNPLFMAGQSASRTLAINLLSALKGMQFTRLQLSWQGEPHIRLGQRIRVWDTENGYTDACITSLSWQGEEGFTLQSDCTYQPEVENVGRLITSTGGLNAALLQGEVNGALLRAESIAAGKLAAASVTAEKLSASCVTTEKLAADSITSDHLQADSVRAKHLAAASVTSEKLAAGAVTANEIQTGTITADKMQSGTITAESGIIADGCIGTTQIADGSITEAKIVSMNADVITSGTLQTDRLLLTGENGVIYEINASSSGLSQSELTDEKYREKLDGSVLVAKSITAEQIAAQSITANEILSGAITTDKLSTHAVTADKIAARAITANHLSSDVGSSLDISGNQSVTLAVSHAMDGLQLDGRNLLLNSRNEVTNSNHFITQFVPSSPLEAGEEYTVTVCATPGELTTDFRLYFSGGYDCNAILTFNGGGKQVVSQTFHVLYASGRTPDVDISYANARFYSFPARNGSTSTLHWVKIEKGSVATGWTPAPEDGATLVNTTTLRLDDTGIHMKTGGTFTVDSDAFSIDANGNMTANAGSIGGWEIAPGALHSGEGTHHVRLSTEDATYGIWAGAEGAASAPFRVARDGTVYLTKLYVTDENGVAQSSPVNLRTSYWKMDKAYARSVRNMSVSGNTLTLELYDGTKVNFSKPTASGGSSVANIVQAWSGGRMTISTDTEGMVLTGEVSCSVNSDPKNLWWSGNRAYFDVTSDKGTIVNDMSINAASRYNAGWNECRSAATAVNNVYQLSATPQYPMYFLINGSYVSAGSGWMKGKSQGTLYTLPAAK